jgi:hypothetical protein
MKLIEGKCFCGNPNSFYTNNFTIAPFFFPLLVQHMRSIFLKIIVKVRWLFPRISPRLLLSIACTPGDQFFLETITCAGYFLEFLLD